MPHLYYILRDHVPVPVEMQEWAQWFSNGERIVKKTYGGDDTEVSTVFMGLDHSFGMGGPPILFETMVFRHGHGEEARRTATWDEALAAHVDMCIQVFGHAPPDLVKPTPPPQKRRVFFEEEG